MGPKTHAKSVVPKSKPIVKLIVLVGRRAIAIGIPRKEVFPINPPNCKEKFEKLCLSIFIELIINTSKAIEKKAKREVLIRSIFIPAFSNKPITLRGIPNLINFLEICSDNFGRFLPIKNPIVKNGIILINRL